MAKIGKITRRDQTEIEEKLAIFQTRDTLVKNKGTFEDSIPMFLRKDPTSSVQLIESRCSLSPPRGRVKHRLGEGAFARTHARYAHTAGFRFSCSPFTGGAESAD